MTSFAVVDLETTGFSPAKYHRVVEIGVVLVDDRGTVEYEWSTLVNPHRDLGPTSIHGVTGAMIAEAPTFADVAGDLSVLLDHRVLVAHNARFDVAFLEAEWQRLDRSWAFDALCTMQLARRRGLPGKLSQCCSEIGVTNDEAHHALGDARVTAMLLSYLGPSPDEVPAPVHIPPLLPPWNGRAFPRTAAPKMVASGLMPVLIDRLPDAASHGLDAPAGAVESYRDVLDLALDDRMLTPDEVDDLASLAQSWGLRLDHVTQIHESYLTGLVAVAAADGVFTDAEMADLRRVGDLLSVDRDTLDRLIAEADSVDHASTTPETGAAMSMVGATASDPGLAGRSVCFTGESSCLLDGRPLTRERASLLAAAQGLTVLKGVTKKLDILVVADPDSQSSKARKAREYGTRIMAERAFWDRLGVAVD